MLNCMQMQSLQRQAAPMQWGRLNTWLGIAWLQPRGRVLLKQGLWFGLEEPQVEPRDVCAKDHKRHRLEDTPKEKSPCHCEKVEDHWKVLQRHIRWLLHAP